MASGLFREFTEANKSAAVKQLIKDSTPDADFFFMVILSVLMATFGLLLGNTPVLIGSMLIAPLLSPLLSLSLGVVFSDGKLISRSFYTILKSFAFSVFLSFLMGIIFIQFMDQARVDALIQSFSVWNVFFLYLVVAIIAGLAASFASIAPSINAILPGAAIAVTLIPPIAATGVGMALFRWDMISSAMLLFVVNAVGIMFASMIMFSLMNLYTKREIAQRAVAMEDKKNKRETHPEDL